MKYLGPISDPKDMVNKEYVDNNASGHEELTQSQYDQLSQAEKMNGTVYFITDGEPDYTIINDSVPIGAVQAYAGAAVPYGWLFCDGSAVSRTTYSDLFAAIGTTYGSGDGSTTFNVPDLRGRVITGVGTCDGVTYALGDKKSAGVPNITGYISGSDMAVGSYNWSASGALYTAGSYKAMKIARDNNDANVGPKYSNIAIDASRSSTKYGNSSTVQPNTTVANYIIKALNTVSSSALEELDPQSIIFDLFYPIGSYYETSDSTFNPNVQWRGTWEIEIEKNAMVAGTSHSASTTGSNYYTGTMLTLFPKTKYLLLGRGSDTLGGTTTNVSQFYVSSGTAKLFREQTSQPTSNSGNTHVFTAYIETGDGAVGVGVVSYDYSSGYTKNWAITAVPLNQREGANRWHRIA